MICCHLCGQPLVGPDCYNCLLGVPPPPMAVRRMTPSDVAKEKDRLVAVEWASRDIWGRATNEDKAKLLCAVREALVRLLFNPDWVPLGLTYRDGDRIDVTFSVHLTDMDGSLLRLAALKLSEAEFNRKESEMLTGLLGLAEKLREAN